MQQLTDQIATKEEGCRRSEYLASDIDLRNYIVIEQWVRTGVWTGEVAD